MLLINQARITLRSLPHMNAGRVAAPHGDRLPLHMVSSSAERSDGNIKLLSAEHIKRAHGIPCTPD